MAAHWQRVTITTRRGPRTIGRPGPGQGAEEGRDLHHDVQRDEPLHREAERLGREDAREGDDGVHPVLVDEVGAQEAAQVRQGEDPAGGGHHLRGALARGAQHRHPAAGRRGSRKKAGSEKMA